VRGASAAQAATVVSSQSDVPLAELAAAAKAPLWFQVFAGDERAGDAADQAARAGCTAVCVTLSGDPDWRTLGALARRARVPLLLKGVTTPEIATGAFDAGFQGLIVSEYGRNRSSAEEPLVLKLAGIVDAIGGRMPVLADGGFRRGTDILKALAFGATAVLVGRPVIWGLAAYGEDGVQSVVSMLQTELARYMAMCGKPSLSALDRTLVRVHEPRPRTGPAGTGRPGGFGPS
jgi:4-hydroxymandelate oxidase